jgi:hypothetical protein
MSNGHCDSGVLEFDPFVLVSILRILGFSELGVLDVGHEGEKRIACLS